MSKTVSFIAFLLAMTALLFLFSQCSVSKQKNQLYPEQTPITGEIRRFDITTTNTNGSASSNLKEPNTLPPTLNKKSLEQEKKRTTSDNKDESGEKLKTNESDTTGKTKIEDQPESQATSIILQGINFNSGSVELTDSTFPQLVNLAQRLRKKKELRIEIAGFTDNLEAPSSSNRIALLRAEAVRDFLTTNGVESNRLTIKGYGNAYPIADNSNSDGRQKNRRVELHIK